MSIILFDDETHENLKPLTLNKLVSALRIGIFTIEEKWNKYLNDLSVTINSSFLPDAQLVQKIKDLKEDESLYKWFKRSGPKGKETGWVDCNAPIRKDGKVTGYKSCGRKKGEKRSYPACKPTPSKCKDKGKGKTWGKKAAKSKK